MAKSPQKKSPAPKAKDKSFKLNATTLTWGTVATVLAVVVTFTLITVTKSPSTAPSAPPAMIAAATSSLANIPASTFDSVGVASPAAAVLPLTKVANPVALTNKKLPEVLYVGAEFCPYCAAERWALIAALDRFGHFQGIGPMFSAPSPESYPHTPSFTFVNATYSSKYLAFKSYETQTVDHKTLQSLSKADEAIFAKYDTYTYIPSIGSPQYNGSIPFIDVAGQFLQGGASYTPGLLNNLTQGQIADGLADPTNPITQAILATANYMTASICATTHGNPSNVCLSKGVQAAAKAMKITF